MALRLLVRSQEALKVGFGDLELYLSPYRQFGKTKRLRYCLSLAQHSEKIQLMPVLLRIYCQGYSSTFLFAGVMAETELFALLAGHCLSLSAWYMRSSCRGKMKILSRLSC